MHSWLLIYTFTHRRVCVCALTGVGHRAPTEGRSIAEWSAALPDLHVKQAALTPPLLHPRLFVMSSSPLHPRPHLNHSYPFPPWILLRSSLLTSWRYRTLSPFLSLFFFFFKTPALVYTQINPHPKGSVYSLQYRPLSLHLAWASACCAYAHRHHNNHNKHNRRGI